MYFKKCCYVGFLVITSITTVWSQTRVFNQAKKPNIVVIMTDQQHAKMLSASGNPYLNTPAMDEIAANGIRFEQAYCTSPVCGPARSSIITGKMPHQTGVEWNGQSVNTSIPNSGRIFRQNGYEPVWAGKWHLPEPYPQSNGEKNESIQDYTVLPFWNSSEQHHGLGSKTDPPLTKAVVSYLENYNKEKPLFLTISYHNPHDICMYPRKDGWTSKNDSLLEIRYYGHKTKLAPIIGQNPNFIDILPPLPHNHGIEKGEPKFISEKRKHHKEYGVETMFANQEFDSIEWKGYLNAYHKLTEMVDVEIGKVLQSLKDNGYWENTMIVFTSDHGDGAAAHKWAAKLSFYEESATVPIIVSWPEMKNKGMVDCQNSVSQIDILPTLLDYSGIEVAHKFSGSSLLKLASQNKPKWRDYTVVELADFVKDKSRKGRMIRLGPYKYSIYSTGEEQLFHIGNDPGEMQNLVDEPLLASVVKKCQDSLEEWGRDTKDDFILSIL
ncbi:sulfatase-like hydrolase/transferase [Aurantibacter crassamenti]|uniref:sulfatase family protein n=1 Tax=Aurantibacter crassamenti TaxID=1837375 RepID=UPI00193A587B|nr:sulfatase-like hydrolase/transferase [Aurantibacter crassamenti]MBM1106258.1 sulfatase-like hydrolase/transferase [Aurantibacter crassamenti]